MPTLDRFESLFRAAVKEQYTHTDVKLERAALITDLPEPESRRLLEQVRGSIPALAATEWELLCDGTYDDPRGLLDRIEALRLDLLCSYRHLYTRAKEWPYSLGSYVDVLAQTTSMPLLLLPHPSDRGELQERSVSDVLVLTDHITGSEELVRKAACVAPRDGKLVLVHIEDDQTFARYADIISKLPEVNTERTNDAIRDRLLQEARDYIDTAEAALTEAKPDLEVVSEVLMGHLVKQVRELVERHDVDLIALAVKDEDQLAMHGLAYPLAIEFSEIPMLLV